MTPEAVAELVAETPMPTGYSLVVRKQRQFAHRSLWSIQVHRDGAKVHGRAWYSPAHGIVAAQRWAWDDHTSQSELVLVRR